MTSAPSLAGKTAVVTGASSGIGRATAERLGGAGAHVFLAGRSVAPMEASKKRIEEGGGRASTVVHDVRDVKQVQDLVAAAVRDTGRLDVMVNNAGVSFPVRIADADPEDWRTMLETNVLALLVGCQAAIRAMRECRAEGHIVNVSSIAAQRQDSGVYGATKHAVNCISASLRTELEEDSIRVVNLMPGAIVTNFARNFDPEVVTALVRSSGVELELKRGEKISDEVLERIAPLYRQMLGAPEDVADAVLYAVTQPIHVNVADIVVRPPKQIHL
jgi:NADP-dependent 3-hydroxy acid dehydrogenase YdfG